MQIEFSTFLIQDVTLPLNTIGNALPTFCCLEGLQSTAFFLDCPNYLKDFLKIAEQRSLWCSDLQYGANFI
jgi:hypothetical protein